MKNTINILGIDNVFCEVLNLDQALHFYQQLGFSQKLVIPPLKAILLSIGQEEPGLIICEKQTVFPSKMWIETHNAMHMKSHCESIGIQGREIHTATGITFEVTDPSGNVIGFCDYSKKPELARTNSDSLKHLAETYAHKIWNEKNLNAIDLFIDQEVIIHSLLGDFHGQEFMRQVVNTWLKGFPDLKVKNTATICEKDTIVIHWQAQGSHQGEFKGRKPTGKQVDYAGVTIYRIRNHKIVEYWAYLDMQHLLNQLE